MMDDLTANKDHIPCQSWVSQNGWSTTSAQGSLLNPVSTSQHLSLGSLSNQRSSYNHLQVPNPSCMGDLGTLLSRNNTHQSAMYKTPQTDSNPSIGSLFTNTANPFAQEIPHTSSMLLSANQRKNVPSLSHTQRHPAQHLSLPPPQSPYKGSFQPQITSQGLTNGLQNVPISLQTREQRVSNSFEGAFVEFAGVAGGAHSYSSTSQEQCQWIPPSLCRGAVSESSSGAAAHSNKEQPQGEHIGPQAVNGKQRLSLLNQRAQLLQQLAELDKALESIPPEGSSENQSLHTANLSSTSMQDSSQCADTKSSDAQPLTAQSEKKHPHTGGAESGDDEDNPVSDDDDFSELIPDPAGFSSDDSVHSRPASPVEEKPTIPDDESDKSDSSACKPDVGTPIESKSFSWKKSSTVPVTPATYCKEKRCYTRKNYCLFCSKPMAKMARHFEAIHSDKPEVAVAFQYPKNSKERLKIWKRLTNEGNFAHNKEVLKTGKGQLTARKRPRKTGQAQDFLHCLYCRGLFLKHCLFKHIRSCPERVKDESKSDNKKRRIASLCAMEAAEDLGITDGLKDLLSVMTYDDVTRAIMDDPIILQLGELYFKQHGSNERKHDYIRQNIRQTARLVLELQNTNSIKKLEDVFFPSNFPHVVSAVKVLAGYDQESKSYKIPSLAVKVGYNIQKTCSIVEANAVRRGDESAAASARKFLSVYRAKWTSLISSSALKTLRKTKKMGEKKVPCARDVKRLNAHLEKVHEDAEEKLRNTTSVENYCALTKVILARIILFNRRCAREVSYVELEAYKSRKKSSSLTGMDASVTDLERAMCKFFTRIDIRGKCGRMVPVFLKPSFESALELIVQVRETCGINEKNPYLFARPVGVSAYHGSDCVQRFVRACGAEDPEALESKKIRKHFAETLQMMNLDENETKQVLDQKRTLRRDEGSHQASSWNQNESFSARSGPSKTRKRSAPSDSKGSKGKGVHRTWGEAEVQAVEKHMMRFIKKHRVPQKDDCVDCLEAEPEALSTRTWRGVKDYVRNRITALKRSSKT